MPVKLYCAKRKPYVNSVQKRRRLLWARSHLDGPSHSGNVYCGQMNQYFRYFWEEWTPCAPDQRRKGSSSLLPATSPKARVCHGMGLCQCPGKGNLHFCDGTINAEKYIEILEHNMLPSRRHLFQDVHAFSTDNANHILHTLQSPGCGGRGYGYLTGLPAVLTCLQ